MMNAQLIKRDSKWHDLKVAKQVLVSLTSKINLSQSSAKSNLLVLGNISLYYLATSIASLYFWGVPTIPFMNYYVDGLLLSVFNLQYYYLSCSMVALFCMAILASNVLLSPAKTSLSIKLISVAYFIAIIMSVVLMIDANNTEVVGFIYMLDDAAQTVIDLTLITAGVSCMTQLMRSRSLY